jgi:hypothetical protein
MGLPKASAVRAEARNFIVLGFGKDIDSFSNTFVNLDETKFGDRCETVTGETKAILK